LSQRASADENRGTARYSGGSETIGTPKYTLVLGIVLIGAESGGAYSRRRSELTGPGAATQMSGIEWGDGRYTARLVCPRENKATARLRRAL
jgi:hypothetical protein